MKLLINGVDVTSLMVSDDPSAAQSTDDLNAHGTMGLRLEDYAGTFAPVDGQTVQLYTPDDATLYFGGTIDTVDKDIDLLFSGKTTFAIQCVDKSQIPSRFIAFEIYTTVTAGAIIRDLISKYLATDGITNTGVIDGPTISSFVVNRITVKDAFDQLSALTGYGWTIDGAGVCYFNARETIIAPFVVDSTTVKCTKLTVRYSRDQYRNRQYVAGGTDLTTSRTDSFVGDSTRKTFTTQFPVAKAPTVTVNGVSKTIGIGGLDTGKDWYWNESANQISQDSGATSLTSGQTLAVTYQGYFPVLALAQDDAAIAARKAIEGGSGIYDNRVDQPSLNSAAMAMSTAAALIARFNAAPKLVMTFTQLDGLRAGQLLTVNRSDVGIAGEYLITSISGTCAYEDNADSWTFTVTATEGSAVGGWTEFFIALAAATRTDLASANQVLQFLRTQTEPVTLGDSVVASTSAPETRIGTGMIGYMEIAA